MEFIQLMAFDNYISAHIAMGRLQEEGMTCWLKDENTVTIDPILSNAVGGIKLMVLKTEAEKAWEILEGEKRAQQALLPCPNCRSTNVELVSTPRKVSNWASAIIGFFFTSYAMPVDKVLHCFDCEHEFANEV
jgi:hypothetical protein